MNDQTIPLSLRTIAGVFSKANENSGFWEVRGYCWKKLGSTLKTLAVFILEDEQIVSDGTNRLMSNKSIKVRLTFTLRRTETNKWSICPSWGTELAKRAMFCSKFASKLLELAAVLNSHKSTKPSDDLSVQTICSSFSVKTATESIIDNHLNKQWPSLLHCTLHLFQVLRNSHQIEWERKLSVLNSQPVLKHWANIEIRSTVAHTKLREYPPNAVCREN